MMSRGGGDVRAPGRTPRTQASGRQGATCPAAGGEAVPPRAVAEGKTPFPSRGRPFPRHPQPEPERPQP